MEEHPVRLLLVDLSPSIGLAERLLWELATRLPRERYAVRVWLSAQASADALAEALEAAGFGVERLDESGSRWNPRTPFQLWLKLRRERAQLVHVHHLAEPGSLRVARSAAADGVPVLITRHDGGDAGSGVSQTHPDVRRVYERADVIAATSRGTAELIPRAWGVARDRVRFIPYGTDLVEEELELEDARGWREQLGASLQRPLWVCPLRLEPRRGHEVLLDALARVRERECDFTMAFTHDGPLRPELERRAAALGLERRLHFIEGSDDLGPLLVAADAVVFPVLDGPLPLTLLDAMARARPVVASAIDVVTEVIDDGVEGTLVPPGEIGALAQRLEALHRHPEAAESLGHAAWMRARDTLTWSHIVERYEDAYDDVLGLTSFAPERSSSPASLPPSRR